MSDWQKPAFTELAMNAEIGSYQEDTGGRGNPPIVDEVTALAAATEGTARAVPLQAFVDEQE
jgi:hypothetical protein